IIIRAIYSIVVVGIVRSAGLGLERNGLPRRSARRHVLLISSFSFSSRCSYRVALDTRHNVATTRQPYAPFSSYFRPLCSHLRGRRH
ncbi:hypothetical protein BGY98DRAFT_990037, partial [Russula aff. rugulosa BPL654]